MSKTIVHTEMLDKNTQLEVREHDTSDPKKYTFRLMYLNDDGEYYGSGGDGQWYETLAACIAAGHIDYQLDHAD